jgi:sensor domain CHASE-containing protein
MAIALVILACLQGVVIGVLAADYMARRTDIKARQALKDELVSTQKALAELHNKNADAMRALQDKVNAHSMALASGVKFK